MRVRASVSHGRWVAIWHPSVIGSPKLGTWKLSSGQWPAEAPVYRYWRVGPLEVRYLAEALAPLDVVHHDGTP